MGSYEGSHVMEYGEKEINKEILYMYLGTNHANDNLTFVDYDHNSVIRHSSSKTVNQRDADLLHFWHKFLKAPEGTTRKAEAQTQFLEAMSHRDRLDNSIKLIGKLLFGIEKGTDILQSVRPEGQPLVGDWKCHKTMVQTFETHCGSLSQYGMKHMRSIANICNVGMTVEQMNEAPSQACTSVPSNRWSSLHKGFTA